MTKKHKMGREVAEGLHEMMMKVVRLKKELKARSPCFVIMAGKIIGKPSKLCRD